MVRPDHALWAEFLKWTLLRPDSMNVFRTQRARPDVRGALRGLGTQHLVFQLEHGWLVVGPTGVTVVTAGADDPVAASIWASDRADQMRSDLAVEMPWVPFVDALVVVDHVDETIGVLACGAIPCSMLRSSIMDGPHTVDEEALARITRVALHHRV